MAVIPPAWVHYPTWKPLLQEEGQRRLPRPFLNPRRHLVQIDAIEADLVLVVPCLVEIEQPQVQLIGIVAIRVLVERLAGQSYQSSENFALI